MIEVEDATLETMGSSIMRLALRHRAIVTVALLSALVLNLTLVGQLSPPDPGERSVPLAGQCQGGGEGCAEHPLIPPPANGLPRIDAPPAPIFGALMAVAQPAPAAVHTAILDPPLQPPALTNTA